MSSGGTTGPAPFNVYALDAEQRAAAVKKLEEAFESAGPRFGKAVQALQKATEGADPIEVMGAMTLYVGSVEAGTNPEHDRPFGLFQHHLELAQAALLRFGAEQDRQLLIAHVERVAAAVKDFNEAWIALQAQKVSRAAAANRSLEAVAMRLRVNSSTRRGWGYRSRMAPMLRELFAPLDDTVAEQLGFAPSAFPGWWEAIFNRVDERLDQHRRSVSEAFGWPADDDWEDRVGERFGHLLSDPEKLAQIKTGDEELRRGYIIQCSDRLAHEIYRFSLDDLMELMPVPSSPEVVKRIVDTWSLEIGEDGGVDVGNLVMDNPVVDLPFVASGDRSWHVFCGWLFFHNPFGLIEALLRDDESSFDLYLQRRGEFVEERAAALFAAALPNAEVDRSVFSTNPDDGKEYENDVLVRTSTYVIVAEAKGGRLPAAARRGKGRFLRERIEDLLVSPSEQGQRLVDRLVSSGERLEMSRNDGGEPLYVEGSHVRRGIVVGVTLEPVAEVLPRAVDIAESSLTERDVEALAYSISLPDLELALDLLDHPSEILHYLGRRTEIERSTFLEGDEVDLLALYLETGFNVGEREFSGRDLLDVTGLSDPIDVWHYRREAGLEAEKPRSKRTEWWEAVLTRVEKRKGDRWAEIGVSMCNLAPPEQQEFEEAMYELRRTVTTGEREPTDLVVFHNGPPQRRDVFCGLIVISPSREDRQIQYEQAAASVISKTPGLDRLTILAWTPVPIDLPYYALLLYEQPQSEPRAVS
jgi:hypothetical protein